MFLKSSGIFLFLIRRKWIFIALLIVTPLGFLFKNYSGPGHRWFNNYGAGLLYEVFWCLVIFFFIPQKRYAAFIAIGVFVVTSVLEILQLWHPLFLEKIRSTFLGAAILGTTFVWWDFLYYVLGSLFGLFLMRALSKKTESSNSILHSDGRTEKHYN